MKTLISTIALIGSLGIIYSLPFNSTTAPILVLSNNVCFNSMTNDGHHGSAAVLGGKCKWDPSDHNITICAAHMVEMIDGLPSAYGVSNLDFIGLQEASRWRALQAASKVLSSLNPIHTRQDKEDAVTFYDPAKYSLAHSWSDDLGCGRPFQISIFKEGVIFINLLMDMAAKPLSIIFRKDSVANSWSN